MSDRFISHMLSRHIRIEEDVIDQLSQDTLAKMIGATRSWVRSFLHKFKKLGALSSMESAATRPTHLGGPQVSCLHH